MKWQRVTKARPCPSCSKPDWCAWAPSGELLACERSSSPPPGMRLVKPRNGGALFAFEEDASGDGRARWKRDMPDAEEEEPGRDWHAVAKRFYSALDDGRLSELARDLGVHSQALRTLGVGWAGEEDLRELSAGGKDWDKDYPEGAYTLPERNAVAKVIGLGLRTRDARKGFVSGARRGLVFSRALDKAQGMALVVEGASDTAAALTLGLPAVGRPSCSGGVDHLIELLRGRDVLILGERDEKPDGSWPGRNGAIRVAKKLETAWRTPVRWALPPEGVKDLREWLRSRMADGLDLSNREACLAAGRELMQGLKEIAEQPEEDLGEGCEPWDEPVPLGPPPLPSFPVEQLGGRLSEYVGAVAQCYQVPTDVPAMLALSAIALCVSKRYEVRVRPDWAEALTVYVAVAMDPGERKTRVLRTLRKPLADIEREVAINLADDIRSAERNRGLAEDCVGSLRKKAASATAGPEARTLAEAELDDAYRTLDEITVPVPPRLFIDDTTPEALGRIIADNGGRIGALSSEGGVFETLAGRYQKGIPNIDLVLKGWDGSEPWILDRKGENRRVNAPIVTYGFAVQPDVIRGLAEKPGFRGRGLIGRFLYSLPQSLMGGRDICPPPVPGELLEWWARLMRDLQGAHEERDENGEILTRGIAFTDGARLALENFAREMEARLGPAGDLRIMTDWAGKLVGTTGRIAGLLHVADAPGNVERSVPGNAVRRAVIIARYLIPHAQAALDLMEADPVVERARHLLAWILRRGELEFSSRDALDGMRRECRRMAHVQEALDDLAERSYVRREDTSHEGGPGRPRSPQWEVNPRALAPAEPSAESAEPHKGDGAGLSADIADGSGDSTEAERQDEVAPTEEDLQWEEV